MEVESLLLSNRLLNFQNKIRISNNFEPTRSSIKRIAFKPKNRKLSLLLLPTKPYNINTKLAFIILNTILIVLISHCISNSNQVESLNCYHCSSVDNPGCDESFSGRANITETDCEKHINQPAKVCRKIVQYIEHKKVVIRSCGSIDDHDEKDRKSMCYKRSGTFAIMMESCNCYTDNCNHSASLVPNQSVLVIFSSLILLLLLSISMSSSGNFLKKNACS